MDVAEVFIYIGIGVVIHDIDDGLLGSCVIYGDTTMNTYSRFAVDFFSAVSAIHRITSLYVPDLGTIY